MIDGSESFDPDVDPSEDMDLTYKWYCMQKNDESIDLNNTASIARIILPKQSLTEQSDFKGCFGNGPGLLSGTISF